MSSILLGSLAYSDIDNTNIITPKINKGLDSVYNSDLENSINMIEKRQTMQNYSKPEYLSQFDELRLDNISEPVGVNSAHTTMTGVNTSLQRNLDFTNGYSQFQKDDMHYGVTNDFTHNNMTPNTSRRDYTVDSRSQRKLANFTGISDTWVPKKEKVPLFQPMADLTWVNGMPTVTDKLTSRYLPSNKNNFGNLPFQTNVKVRPGVEMDNQEGNYAVYRINPRTVDQLRSDINQKLSYETKLLESFKKGELRAPDPTLTKQKIPDFRETKFDDLVASRSTTEGPKQIGDYTNITTQRNESINYQPGPSVNTSRGSGPDKNKTNFEAAKKSSYINDPTHAVTNVTNRPVMTNTQSFINYENQRATTNTQYEGSVSNALNSGIYTVDYKDVPLTTLRDLMIHGDTNIGVNGSQTKGNYIFSNDMVLPVTNRETTSHDQILGPQSNIKMVQTFDNKDIAKTTLRQNTSHNILLNTNPQEKQTPIYNNDNAKSTLRPETSHNIITNPSTQTSNVPIHNNDLAKNTIRQGLSHNIITNITSQDKHVPIYNNDNAKPTLRPDTSYNLAINVRPTESSCYTKLSDIAKQTIKQTTLFAMPEKNIRGEIEATYVELQDDMKPTIKQTTLISNRPTGNISSVNSNYSYARDTCDTTKTTIRQQTETTQQIGSASGQFNEGTYVRDLTETSKPTIRQQTETTKQIGSASGQFNEGTYVRDLTETSKPTIRQQTESTKQIGSACGQFNEGTYVRDLTETSKPTIRQQTESTKQIGPANSQYKEVGYARDVQDTAKPTIKQTTLHATPVGRLTNSNMGNYTRDSTDIAKTTIKQTTLLEGYTGGVHGEIDGQISHDAANNMKIDERREISTFNRTPNGKGDLNGPYIDPENVKFNDKRTLYSHVSHPHKSLDFSVMPTVAQSIIETVYSMSKPVIETSSYYVNPYYINTLKNNPLVNDIYHQKNV